MGNLDMLQEALPGFGPDPARPGEWLIDARTRVVAPDDDDMAVYRFDGRGPQHGVLCWMVRFDRSVPVAAVAAVALTADDEEDAVKAVPTCVKCGRELAYANALPTTVSFEHDLDGTLLATVGVDTSELASDWTPVCVCGDGTLREGDDDRVVELLHAVAEKSSPEQTVALP